MLDPMVKEFLKLANISQSYERKIFLVFFDSRCTDYYVYQFVLVLCF